MRRPDTITMTMRELDRLKVVEAVVRGKLKPWRAAEKLQLSTRQIERLAARYRQDGPAGLVSRKRGSTPGNRALDRGLEARVRGLIRDSYADFGPTLAAEKLRERHGIDLAKETVRRIMVDAGFWVPRRQRPPKVHQPRNRRACLSELVQIDGSDHRWFEDRAPACTLLVYVDDATGRLMQLLFVPTESTPAYFAATRAYIERHGKPLTFYSDKFSVFRVNAKANAEGCGYTQFGRALYELNIDILCANSSPAKGRVERMNGTLQDRLVKELRLRGISSMAAANAYAPTFIADFNARFAKVPKSVFDAHRPLRGDEAVRQGDVPARGSAGEPAVDPSLYRSGRLPGRARRVVGRRRFPALHHLLPPLSDRPGRHRGEQAARLRAGHRCLGAGAARRLAPGWSFAHAAGRAAAAAPPAAGRQAPAADQPAGPGAGDQGHSPALAGRLPPDSGRRAAPCRRAASDP